MSLMYQYTSSSPDDCASKCRARLWRKEMGDLISSSPTLTEKALAAGHLGGWDQVIKSWEKSWDVMGVHEIYGDFMGFHGISLDFMGKL